MKRKTLAITVAALALIALTATGALLALAATAGATQHCGSASPAQLRAAADSNYAARLEDLARCDSR